MAEILEKSLPSERFKIQFLEKSLQATHNLRTAFDNKANFLLGVSGVLFVLAIGFASNVFFLILAVLSLLSAIFCILSIGLPFRRLGFKESNNLFCWWGVKGKTYGDYLKCLQEKINNEDDLIREYSQEIYSLYQNSIRYKVVFLKLANFSLLIGFLVVFISLFFSH